MEHHVIVAESRGHRLTLAQARGEEAALKPCPRNSERGPLYRARPAPSRTIPPGKINLKAKVFNTNYFETEPEPIRFDQSAVERQS